MAKRKNHWVDLLDGPADLANTRTLNPSIDAAANRWPELWRDAFRERAAIMWTDAADKFVALTAWREAYTATIAHAQAEGVTLEDGIDRTTFEERQATPTWNTRPQDVPEDCRRGLMDVSRSGYRPRQIQSVKVGNRVAFTLRALRADTEMQLSGRHRRQ